ncbi:unnamed protein product [Cuscuta campestris]|uniref:Uncharacterized protein n=1 Tax=Cuscuta campestris TaxID=132261 RepID=A0A484NQJ3_9ASTE|nr:unnamed protein product [Cuscuta campestris]
MARRSIPPEMKHARGLAGLGGYSPTLMEGTAGVPLSRARSSPERSLRSAARRRREDLPELEESLVYWTAMLAAVANGSSKLVAGYNFAGSPSGHGSKLTGERLSKGSLEKTGIRGVHRRLAAAVRGSPEEGGVPRRPAAAVRGSPA